MYHCLPGRAKYGEKKKARIVTCSCCTPPRKMKAGALPTHRRTVLRKRDAADMQAFGKRMSASLSGPVSGMDRETVMAMSLCMGAEN